MKRDAPSAQGEFDLGGVRWPRPFRIRRLGHFGICVADPERSKDFYCRLLGFRISDPLDFTHRLPEDKRGKVGPTVGYFSRHGTDHHSFVFFPRGAYSAVNAWAAKPQGTVNQITWQVGSLQEVSDAFDWFTQRGKPIRRAGRDLPGSNWHFYPPDPEGHTNELYYGIEQIGWDGYSKPREMYGVRYAKPPELPHKSELAEVLDATAQGIPIVKGLRAEEVGEEKYNVEGILLARPFKIVRHGPVRLFAENMESMVAFYRDDLGFTVTEEVEYKGHRCVFLRANTEHHCLAIYPIALRKELGLSEHTTLMSFGLQVGSYRQLREAIAFLKGEGVQIRYLPPELFPGIDYCAFAIDQDGFAFQLYYYMEQVGWDGKPRPAELRPKIDNARWPDSVAGQSDAFLGEPYLGPLG
ncbi:MAG: VOC family protein [Betaproteobacteria bacterium]|nr:VOC family protein [Betaproteobacteria bacterium]